MVESTAVGSGRARAVSPGRRAPTRRLRTRGNSEAQAHRVAGRAPSWTVSPLAATRVTGTATVMARAESTRTITAVAGPSLGSDPRRSRPVGRIGGVVGLSDDRAERALATRLGPGACLLRDSSDGDLPLVADWDACHVKGAPVLDVAEWRSIVSTRTLSSVEGAFAIAWLDPDGTLGLARDAIGERTLYYAEVGKGVIFASTIHALLATGLVARSIDFAGLAAYLSFAYVPGRETLTANVHEVLPGEIVELRAGTITRS